MLSNVDSMWSPHTVHRGEHCGQPCRLTICGFEANPNNNLSIRTADCGTFCGKARQIFVDLETNICGRVNKYLFLARDRDNKYF